MNELNLFRFKTVLSNVLNEVHGFDMSLVSEGEWNKLFDAYEDGAEIEDIAQSIVDGTAYDKYFDEEVKKQ